MKNKKNTPPAPIVCRLNNTSLNFDGNSLIFASIIQTLNLDETAITNFFDYLNYFSLENFEILIRIFPNKRMI